MGLVYKNGRYGLQADATYLDFRAILKLPQWARVRPLVPSTLQFNDILGVGLAPVVPAPDQRYHYSNFSQTAQVAASLNGQGHAKESMLWVHLAAEFLAKHLIAKITFAYARVHTASLPPPPGNKKKDWLITHDVSDVLTAAQRVVPSLTTSTNISSMVFHATQFKGKLGPWQYARYSDPASVLHLAYCRSAFGAFHADLMTFERNLNAHGGLPW